MEGNQRFPSETNYTSSSNRSVLTEAYEEDMTEKDIVPLRRVALVSDEDQTEIYICLVWTKGKIGAAYYDSSTCLIYTFADHPENAPDFLLAKMMLKQVMPQVVILSSRTDENLLKIVKEYKKPSDNEIEEDETARFIQLLPHIYFSYEVSRHRLRLLNLPSIAHSFSDSERHLYMSSLINFTNISLVRATGALLKFLEKRRVGIQLEDENAHVPILGITDFSLNDVVTIDENSFSALQIFHTEWAPSIQAKRGGVREGLSLFGIFNKCKSTIGSKFLRKLLLQPTTNIEILKQRQDAIAYFLTPQNIERVSSLQDCLRHVKHIARVLSHMTTAHASISDWKVLHKTIYNAVLIRDICSSESQHIEIFKKIKQTFTPDLCRISSLIQKIVDIEESDNQNHFVVKPGVDEELDHKKRTYNGLPDFMTKVAQEELNKLNDDIQQCSVIYLPQIGYLLAIPQTEKMKSENDYDIPGLEFVFLSNDVVHYKSPNTKELDALLGDTQCEIIDHETQIMHKLQNIILEASVVLLDVMRYSAELDCLIALSLIAKEYDYSRPELTRDGTIHIIKGRHPLQELCVNSFVPNDTSSGGKYGKMKIITGPNASGKSVYLKQVALIVYLAHIGSFVPAESAKITVVDQIFTRIRTLNSISVGLSSFMIELNQMSAALRNATSNSLVVIDEFGKGTESLDGLVLLASSLQYWLKKDINCPHCFISTHFNSLLNTFLFSDEITFQTMDFLQEDENLIFLYQLKEGIADGSYAHNVASTAGIQPQLIERGKEITNVLKNNEGIAPITDVISSDKLKRYLSICQTFLSMDLDSEDISTFLDSILEGERKAMCQADNKCADVIV